MTFQALSAALCGLQQRPYESCQDYYDRMVQITVLLHERHSNRFRPGELTWMTKEYFYSGLRPRTSPHCGSPEGPPECLLYESACSPTGEQAE